MHDKGKSIVAPSQVRVDAVLRTEWEIAGKFSGRTGVRFIRSCRVQVLVSVMHGVCCLTNGF
jgi:hypothetical protein